MAQVWRWMLVGVAMLAFGTGAGAQENWSSLPAPVASLVGGTFSLDLDESETTSALVGGLRVDFPLTRLLSVEPGVERLTWTESGEDGGDETRWVGDLAVRAGYPVGRLRPFAGGNLGVAIDFDDNRAPGQKFVDVGYGAHGGVRVQVVPQLFVQAEARARWLDGGDQRWLVYTAGVGLRF